MCRPAGKPGQTEPNYSSFFSSPALGISQFSMSHNFSLILSREPWQIYILHYVMLSFKCQLDAAWNPQESWSQRVICIVLALGISVGDCINHVSLTWEDQAQVWVIPSDVNPEKRTWKEANLLLFACLTIILAGEVIYPVDTIAESLDDISLQASSAAWIWASLQESRFGLLRHPASWTK